MIILLAGSSTAGAYAQKMIGYSESNITVKSEQTYCISSKTLHLTDVSVRGVEGSGIENVAAGSQVVIEATVTSNCEISNYPIMMLIAVRDFDGMTTYFVYQNITMNQGDRATISFSWLANRAGNYEIRVLAHTCLACSGDFGLMERIDFSVLDQPLDDDEYIVLTIVGLKSTYQMGEHIVLSVNAKGVSDTIACDSRSPAVVIRNNGNGEAINLTPIIFSRGLQCIDAIPFDKEWTFGDDAGDEILPDTPGSYTVAASLEDVTVEKRFSVE